MVTPGHIWYIGGAKFDQDLSPREGFRSLASKVDEELRDQFLLLHLLFCDQLPVVTSDQL